MSRRIQFPKSPYQILLFGFILIICVGTVLLSLPIASTEHKSIGVLNALFTSTSAVCVTGLTVVDIGSQFTIFGQVVIMLLFQVGGLGFITFAVLFALLMDKKIGLKSRLIIQESTRSFSAQGLVKLVKKILIIAFSFEAIATVILTLRWGPELGWSKGTYYALFHSVSAFNNSGFSLWSDSLMGYVSDPLVNFVISSLFIIGGIGFIVIFDVIEKRSWHKLSLHSKLVLTGTAILLIVGMIVIYCIEIFNPTTLGKLNGWEKLLASYFQAASPRSAGFNTLDISAMLTTTQFFIIIMMFIGAGSGSTGGGIKVNTFMVLILSVWTTIRGKEEVHIYKRRISSQLVMQAFALIMMSVGVILFMTFLLSITESSHPHTFLQLLFEVNSAFTTAGLSLNLTPHLTPLGKILIIITMYIGRLGPLTAAFALAQRTTKSRIRYPKEKLLIG